MRPKNALPGERVQDAELVGFRLPCSEWNPQKSLEVDPTQTRTSASKKGP